MFVFATWTQRRTSCPLKGDARKTGVPPGLATNAPSPTGPQGPTLQIRGRIRSLAIGAFLLALTGMDAPALAAQPSEVAALPADHAASGANCGNCHFNKSPERRKSRHRFTENHDDFTTRQTNQERMCKECHTGVVEASHPTGINPGRSLPPRFPVNDRGELTCSTCHAIETNGTLRKEAGQSSQAFCESCHSASFFAGMADSGGSIMGSGHLSVDKRPLGTADNHSMQCMTCHMENASIAGTRTASIGFMMPGSGAANHSIGSLYRDFSMRRDYRPAGTLPSEILLPEGRVSCVSCHKVFSRKHGEQTVARNLCTQCHNK